MEFISKVGDIILLEGDINYQVIKLIELQNKGYLVLQKINLEKDSLTLLEPKKIIATEVVENSEDYYLQIVTDTQILNNIETLLDNEE